METEQLKQQHLGLELLNPITSGGKGGLPYPPYFPYKSTFFNGFELKFVCELTHLFMKWSLGPKA